ncbi:RHS repeat domain-containing protein [Rothia sp. CCM 9417]|uniref:RHS repeat domain-containing protein n=1 Tax=Rothia sp. CCM 9417 TaxID=3402657 RepID=UPI003AE413E0
MQELQYDECGRLVGTVGADGTEQVLAYDAASQLVSVTGSDGLVREFVYDGLGRRVRETDPDGSVREFAYGPAGYLEGIRVGTGAGESIAHSIEVDALGEIAQIDGINLFWDSTASVPTLVSVAGES